MNAELWNQIMESDYVHIPLPLDENETSEKRMLAKPVLESRTLSDAQSLEGWTARTEYAKLELCDEAQPEDKRCIKFTHPTNLDSWEGAEAGVGRIYAEPGAMFGVGGEDWGEWNRLSAWVYPIADGIKSLTIRLQLYNDGARKVPDKYKRDGHHNVSVKNRRWNHIALEMPYLDRDCVTGVAIEYDMVGHEPDAADSVAWYIGKLELQKVVADDYETWVPARGRISYSHSGYQTGGAKTAIISDTAPEYFRLVDASTGRVVLEKPIIDAGSPADQDNPITEAVKRNNVTARYGGLRVLDFSEVIEPGDYILIAGDIMSRAFPIGDLVWEPSVWKTLNFFLVQRCGYEVPGKHRACHSDLLLTNGAESIVANGGWHDAADLAQGMANTAEATSALLALADALNGRWRSGDGAGGREKSKGGDNRSEGCADYGGRLDKLYKRVLEEAKWGLDYVLKTRFADGARSSYSSSSIWTDGIIGTKDDIRSQAVKSAFMCFDCAYPEALGARSFAGSDPYYAAYCLKIAKEDYKFGEVFLAENRADNGAPRRRRHDEDVLVASAAAMAAAKLFGLTGCAYYMERAVYHADTVIACQQQEFTDWDVPMAGFFYRDRSREIIWHHSHHSHACMPDIALRAMCEEFPDHAGYMKWYYALALSGEYYRKLAAFTKPYGAVPAGVYHEDELDEFRDLTLTGVVQVAEEDYPLYKEMVRNGFPVGKGYFVRAYPVWFSFRGNYNVMLSQAKAMGCAAAVRDDYGLYAAAQSCHEWIVGKNPFCQSTMTGEGHDYAQLYAVQPGQTVGALSVGMQSFRENDVPYWPQVNTATYKEVWICPPAKWMWRMADNLLPAVVCGRLEANSKGGNEYIGGNKHIGGIKHIGVHNYENIHDETEETGDTAAFTHVAKGARYEARVDPRTGYYGITLPAGRYTMSYRGFERDLTVINGKRYTIDGAICSVRAASAQEGNAVTINIEITSADETVLALKAENLFGCDKEIRVTPDANRNGSAIVKAAVIDPARPWIALITPRDNPGDACELLDPRFSA